VHVGMRVCMFIFILYSLG